MKISYYYNIIKGKRLNYWQYLDTSVRLNIFTCTLSHQSLHVTTCIGLMKQDEQTHCTIVSKYINQFKIIKLIAAYPRNA